MGLRPFAILISLSCASAIIGIGCSNKAQSNSNSSSSTPSPSPPATPPTATSSSPLQLKLYTVYDTTSYNNALTFVETSDTTCQATTSAPTATCNVIVPEGRLYFSSVKFVFSWLSTSCPLLIFRPYSYKASSSAAYTPPSGTTAIDCTATPIPAECYGGAARQLVTDFPTFTSLIFFPDEANPATSLTKTLELVSAYSIGHLSNRHAANDLSAAKVGNAYSSAQLGGAGDGYIASTYVDYNITCRDHWYDPATYSISLYITDQDSSTGNGTNNAFYTWREAP